MLSSTRRRLIALFTACAFAGAGIGAALAFWTGVGEPVYGEGVAAAATVPQGSTPTVTLEGSSSVLVNWSATTMSDGEAVDGYLVKRYDSGSGAAQTILSDCTGTVTETSCTETRVPVGTWKYSVTPVVGDNWRGAESAKSAAVTTTTVDFLQPITSPETVRSGPAGSDVGDVDNDGDPDVVVANIFDAAFASVLLNNGVGEFTERTVGSNAATIDVKLGRFDGDGNLDLVLLYQMTPPGTGLLIIFKGNGDGTFTYLGAANELVSTGVRSTKMAVGNFNGDAIDDVAVVNSQNDPATEAGTVMTFLGNPVGNDTFSSSTPAQTLNAQLGAYDIAFADFDGGANDLVVANHNSSSITFLPGNGTGFGAPTNIAAGARVYQLDTANLNAGTSRDIVASVTDSNPSQVRTLFGDGNGGFPTQVTTNAADPGAGSGPHGVVASDLDNDGDKDVAVANGSPESVSILDNHGNGTLSQLPSSPETGVGVPGSLPFEIVSADFDGSGFNDLLVNPVFTNPGESRPLLNQSGNQANLSISQTDSPDPVNAGSNLTYSVTATNGGPSTPTSVKSTVTLPAGVAFNAGASSATCSAAGVGTIVVTCNYGSVAPGTPETQQVVGTVGYTAPASIADTATVAGNLADPVPANNITTGTTTVIRDTAAPTHSLSINSATGAFYNGGNTLYYKGNAAGSFRFVDALADPWSGPASVTYPAIATTGWTHAAETVTTPAGGPYTSQTYSWTTNPANPAGHSISGSDNAGNSSSAAVTFVNDITAPSGGNVSYTNGMVYRTSVPVTTATGTDSGSGINTGTLSLVRAQATLNTTTQACGTFGGFTTTVTLVGGNDTSVVSGNCYMYRYLVADRVGNLATYTSASIAKVDATPYSSSVLANAGLVNYWRVGESTVTTDTFTGTAGTAISARSGEIGASWTTYGSPTTTAVLSNENRARRNAAGFAMYTASGTPPAADYSVQTDINVKSVLSQDAIGITARTTASENFYMARLVVNGATVQWELLKIVNGVATPLGSLPVTLAAGQTHTMKLNVVGSLITMWANGTVVASLNDGSLTGIGKPGLRFGFGGATGVPTNTAGLHADNFNATPMAADSKGTAHGTYWGATMLGQTSAISGDSNTSALFDGVNDHVTMPRQIQDDFSIEFWFKSTQGIGTSAAWTQGAGLVDSNTSGALNDFGTALRSDGRVVAGVGNPDTSIVSTNGSFNNGQWHHVAFTRTRATGAMALYVDGNPEGTATGTANTTLNATANINLGRLQNGINYYAGTLDEVATYSTVLSQATISDHYARR